MFWPLLGRLHLNLLKTLFKFMEGFFFFFFLILEFTNSTSPLQANIVCFSPLRMVVSLTVLKMFSCKGVETPP